MQRLKLVSITTLLSNTVVLTTFFSNSHHINFTNYLPKCHMMRTMRHPLHHKPELQWNHHRSNHLIEHEVLHNRHSGSFTLPLDGIPAIPNNTVGYDFRIIAEKTSSGNSPDLTATLALQQTT